MVDFIYSLMTDKRQGRFVDPLKWMLYLVSLGYAFAIWVRKILYRAGIFKARHVPMKIVSVGNLTLGGTGKTPFVITLARLMKDEVGKDVCILIRGYGWDEQAMLRKNIPDVPVFVGENRAKSAHRAIKYHGSDTAILDDGFQHWELKRDLDIVLIDSRNPFGNGHLFPRGILREPVTALKRADIAVFTKVAKFGRGTAQLRDMVRAINPGIIFLDAVHVPHHLYDVKTKKFFGLDHVGGKDVVLLSSIGDAFYFEETVRGLGGRIIDHIRFNDHHNYTAADIDAIVQRCSQKRFDMLVTTEKDAVKLQRLGLSVGTYQLLVLAIELEILSGKEGLIARLHSLYIR